MGPWTQEQIRVARRARFGTVLNYLGAYHKRDVEFSPLYPERGSVRVYVSYQGRDFRFIFTGEKWLDESLLDGEPRHGGGGSIDFVQYVAGCNFVHAVKICLDALSVALPVKSGPDIGDSPDSVL